MRAAMLLLALAAQHLTFDVASVKRSTSTAYRPPFRVTGGGGIDANATLDLYLVLAYKVAAFQIVNLPEWAHSEDYTIVAHTAPGTVQKVPGKRDDELLDRLCALLADRFHLVIHREMREMPVYVLTVAKNGPKMPESEKHDITNLRMSRTQVANEGGAPISWLATSLENRVGGKVIDETGLTGFYRFDLHWAPDNLPDATGPSLFTAVQEQLGLKLEAKRRPVEVIVVDHVERPTEN
jgi:uncharacterized protein (TIGR03435 family)